VTASRNRDWSPPPRTNLETKSVARRVASASGTPIRRKAFVFKNYFCPLAFGIEFIRSGGFRLAFRHRRICDAHVHRRMIAPNN
jgi:hypothetical protein